MSQFKTDVRVAVVRPPFLIDFPRHAHTRDEFGHENLLRKVKDKS
jgi:hypothetical protein